ncbi:MAG: hypothetical protein P1U68_05275 [Verrucomicrobiales bacterium]|nr:hypothetical protein [Verrucomicrobiales bacterium]
MNTWGYLILIAALLVLSAFMLYARFAGRSREKSIHHAPSELGTMHLLPAPELTESGEGASSDPLVMDLKPLSDVQIDEPLEAEESGESSYFDELQEAAAGLAMLMRSSPARDRGEPVVFAPEDELQEENEGESNIFEADVEADVVGETESDEAEMPEGADDPIGIDVEVVEEEISELQVNLVEDVKGEELSLINEAMDSMEALIDGGPDFEALEDEIASATAESSSPTDEVEDVPNILPLAEILGNEVAEQFARLDAGLDELDELVTSIEGQLKGMGDFISAGNEDGDISEAA